MTRFKISPTPALRARSGVSANPAPSVPVFRWKLNTYTLHTWEATDYESYGYRKVTKKDITDEHTIVVVAPTEAEAKRIAGDALEPVVRQEHSYSRDNQKSIRVFSVEGEVEQV